MAEELIHQRDDTVAGHRDQVAALVRAIRRVHESPSGYGGVEAFHVANVHDFARRLVAEGVRASEDAP
jgi:hypothetical protein